MTGNYNSIVGMERGEPINRFVTGMSSGRFIPAAGLSTMCGAAVETDDETGLAVRAAAVRVGPYLEEQKPQFWE
jgi:hypothetical protein